MSLIKAVELSRPACALHSPTVFTACPHAHVAPPRMGLTTSIRANAPRGANHGCAEGGRSTEVGITYPHPPSAANHQALITLSTTGKCGPSVYTSACEPSVSSTSSSTGSSTSVHRRNLPSSTTLSPRFCSGAPATHDVLVGVIRGSACCPGGLRDIPLMREWVMQIACLVLFFSLLVVLRAGLGSSVTMGSTEKR